MSVARLESQYTENTDILDAMEDGRIMDDEDEISTRRECGKLIFVLAIVVTLVMLSEEVGELVLSTQSFLRGIPLVWGLVGICILTCPRRVLLPVAYIVPLASISLLYLVAKVGWVRAGIIWQGIMLLDCIWFLLIRYYWSSFMAALVDPHNKHSKKFVPDNLLRAMRGLDREWAHRISVHKDNKERNTAKSLLSVIVLAMAWGTNEQITVYFLCTRCHLSFLSFALRWTLAQILLTPETLVFTRSIELIIADFASTSAITKVFKRTPAWLLVLWLTLAILATIIVHAVHAKLLFIYAKDPVAESMRTRKSISRELSIEDTRITNGDALIHPTSNDLSREQRRIELRSRTNFHLSVQDEEKQSAAIADMTQAPSSSHVGSNHLGTTHDPNTTALSAASHDQNHFPPSSQ